jgi:hypothetical protein
MQQRARLPAAEAVRMQSDLDFRWRAARNRHPEADAILGDHAHVGQHKLIPRPSGDA